MPLSFSMQTIHSLWITEVASVFCNCELVSIIVKYISLGCSDWILDVVDLRHMWSMVEIKIKRKYCATFSEISIETSNKKSIRLKCVLLIFSISFN